MDGLQEEGNKLRLGMSPLGRDGRSAAILVTTADIADDKLFGFRDQGIVAAMN
jgi:hypothetical protein